MYIIVIYDPAFQNELDGYLATFSLRIINFFKWSFHFLDFGVCFFPAKFDCPVFFAQNINPFSIQIHKINAYTNTKHS